MILSYAALQHSNFLKLRFLWTQLCCIAALQFLKIEVFVITQLCRIAALQFPKIEVFVILSYAALWHSNFLKLRFL